MNNSLAPEHFEVLNELSLIRADPRFAQTRYLVVEGPTDRQVFEKFVQKPWVVRAIGDEKLRDEVNFNFEEVYPRRSARYRVIAFAEYAKDNNLEDITHAIVDRDFDGRPLPALENLSCTDKRDMESTIASTEAFGRLCSIHVLKSSSKAGSTQSADYLRRKFFNIADQVGRIRHLNALNGWSLRFKGIEYRRVVCDRRHRLKIFEVWRFLNENPPPNSRFSGVCLKCLKKSMKGVFGDDGDFSQGHDLCGFLAAILEWPKGWDRINVEEALKSSFRKGDLLKTELGNRLLKREIIRDDGVGPSTQEG